MEGPPAFVDRKEHPVEIEIRQPLRRETMSISVIIPLARSEVEPTALIATLEPMCEIILARGGTRAASMNRAAFAATGDYLWFVHADTVLRPGAIEALKRRLPTRDSIFYFDLRFDGGPLMRLTELGVLIRSRLWQMPFGDQALFMSREIFRALGGYDERAEQGEDHLLIRQAARRGIAVRATGATVLTSARKYRRDGWLRTTWLHLRLTLRQRAQPL